MHAHARLEQRLVTTTTITTTTSTATTTTTTTTTTAARLEQRLVTMREATVCQAGLAAASPERVAAAAASLRKRGWRRASPAVLKAHTRLEIACGAKSWKFRAHASSATAVKSLDTGAPARVTAHVMLESACASKSRSPRRATSASAARHTSTASADVPPPPTLASACSVIESSCGLNSVIRSAARPASADHRSLHGSSRPTPHLAAPEAVLATACAPKVGQRSWSSVVSSSGVSAAAALRCCAGGAPRESLPSCCQARATCRWSKLAACLACSAMS
eukprot:scaffold115342_cov72-Phaeocystis_antarctica.AAC.3